MIPQRNLSLLANRLARQGGRRIPEAVLQRDYCLAWFLVGLSRSPLRERLAFKGGTAIKRCYFGDYRFSEDLDFTLLEEAPLEKIRAELEPVFEDVRRASGIVMQYAREDRQPHANSYTFYLSYEGPLPARAANEVKTDITIRERLVLPLAPRGIVRGYEEYEDLPEAAVVQVYSLDEIAVEKIVALGDRARNEPRDLYDAWYLTSGRHVHLSELMAAIESKLEFRGRTITTLTEEFRNKERRLKRLWSARLAAQMVQLPEFERVFRELRRSLREAGLI
jgi:predicted nucleotidyltransferase component of viral defense system